MSSSGDATLEPGELESLKADPDAFIRKRSSAGDSVHQIGAKVAMAKANLEASRSDVEQPASTQEATVKVERRKRDNGKTLRIVISVFCSIMVYVFLVGLAMIFGFGGLMIQLPAMGVAIAGGKATYEYLKKPLGTGGGMN